MRTRRIGLFGASVCTLVIGIGSAAWACVPGHDHTGANDTDHAAHAAAQAPAAPVITVAPPVEEPVAVPQEQATTSPVAGPTPVTAAPAPAATRTTTAPARTAAAPVPVAPAAATPAPVVATPAPPANVTPVPEAVAPVTTATTAWRETVTEVPASSESSGSGSSVGGVLLAGFGIAVLVLGAAAAIRWRRNVSPPSILPD